MRRNITAGIDIGTSAIRVVLFESTNDSPLPKIIGSASFPSEGMRLGYVVDTQKVAGIIKKTVAEASKAAQVKIKRAYLTVGGVSLEGTLSAGSAIISRADKEVTALDIAKAVSESEELLNLQNKKVLQNIPLNYKLDGKEVYGKAEGMKGAKIEVRSLFITIQRQHLDDMITALGMAGIEILDITPSPLSESTLLLSEKQRAAGCALVDIGAETVIVSLFENGTLMSLQSFPIGGLDITKDIALGLKISLDEAEGVKVGTLVGDFSKKKVDEIIYARLGDIFELVENHLKRQKRSGLLPGGIILTGGGSQIHQIEVIAKEYLRLPARVGPTDIQIPTLFKIRDESWYAVTGVVIKNIGGDTNATLETSLGDNVKSLKTFCKSFFSQLLP